MSDLMLMGVLRAPHDVTDPLAMVQLIDRARQAADEIERLQSRVEVLEELATDLQKFVDLQAEDEGLWGVAQYASEAYIQRGLRGCHQFIEESLAKLQRG